jgi:adenylate cyclase
MLADHPAESDLRNDAPMDFAAAGLLDGLEGEDRAARERLLRRLVDDGFTAEELKVAVAEDRLALLLVERVLGGRYSASQLAERTGMPADQLLRIRRLLGLTETSPDEPVFGEEEVKAAESTRLFLDTGLREEAIAEITRVLGEGMARLAATTAAAFVEAFLEPGDSEEEVAERFAVLAEKLVPAIDPVLTGAYKQHLADAVRRGMLSRAEREAGEPGRSQEVTVCFVDMVGFTRLGAQLDPHELGNVASKLAELATEVTKPPVRLVKTIGDAALFVSIEPAPMVSVALSLLEAFQAADLPVLRGGVAWGTAQQRAGDYYGHAVNLASRVTATARPGSVLATQEVRDAAAEDFDWSYARKHRLKGMKEQVALYRARRLDDADASGANADAEAEAERGKSRGDGKPKKPKADRRRTRASS